LFFWEFAHTVYELHLLADSETSTRIENEPIDNFGFARLAAKMPLRKPPLRQPLIK